MTRIAVIGAAGRMGRCIIETCHEAEGTHVAAAIERPDNSMIGADAGGLAGVGHLDVALVGDLKEVA